MTNVDKSQDEPSNARNGFLSGFMLWAFIVVVFAVF